MSTLLVRRGGFAEAELGPESLALLDVEKGRYYGLDGTALRIWQLLETPTSLEAIGDALVGEYEVDRATCDREVAAFVSRLSDEGLISSVPGEASQSSQVGGRGAS